MSKKTIEQLLKEKSSVKLDIGCGASKMPGFIGMDMLDLPGVDIIHNIEITPWPLPAECISTAIASHILEHITPTGGDARLQPLVDLLVSKKIISKKEADDNLGQPGPVFMRVMNEMWRVMKPGGQFTFVVPYAESHGMYQDPTHINFINETTMRYFDPFDKSQLYYFYHPNPWEIQFNAADRNGVLEVVLKKLAWDKSFSGVRPAESVVEEKLDGKKPRIY